MEYDLALATAETARIAKTSKDVLVIWAYTGGQPICSAGKELLTDVPPHQGMETRRCDATDLQAVTTAIRGVDYVVNCVAGSNRSMLAATQAPDLLPSPVRKRLPEPV